MSENKPKRQSFFSMLFKFLFTGRRKGDLDMFDIIRSVKSHGFEGNVYIEYEGMEDCYYGTKVSLDNVKRIYAEV